MPVYKKRTRAGKQRWSYQFSLQGATRSDRKRVHGPSFATKAEAQRAEAARIVDLEQKTALDKAGANLAVLPKTLAEFLPEFRRKHAAKLAPKTQERYEDQLAYLDPELLKIPLPEITSLHLSREWERLLKDGGHHRATKKPRPLSRRTVKNTAGVLSSAFGRAIRWGLLAANPVTNSEVPKVVRHMAIALTAAQQQIIIDAATGPFGMKTFLLVDAAMGCRRGELLALRWSDIGNGCAMISRSLTQTRAGLVFKLTKTEKPRSVNLTAKALAALEAHRIEQDKFRRQFGPNYRVDLDLVFAHPDGTPLKPDSISATVSALFKRLKIPKPKGGSLHLLRHTHTSELLAAGVPLTAVSARLGHGSIRTTQEIYAHMITGQDEEAVRKLEEYQQRTLAGNPGVGKGDLQ